MRLTVRITHIPKLLKLIDTNKLLETCLEADGQGGWWIEANKEQLFEITRQLEKNRIKYTIKN